MASGLPALFPEAAGPGLGGEEPEASQIRDWGGATHIRS